MNKLSYPALFHKAEEGGFWITFPDLPECITEGDDMQEAYEMASDVLDLAIAFRQESNEPLPSPSEPDTIPAEPDAFCVMIESEYPNPKGR